jgi:hypothetical protein
MDNTVLLSLPLLANKQALQTTFHDEALKTLDALVMLSVIDRDLSSPPGSAEEGDRYLVKAPGSGDDAWQDDHVVVFVDGGWRAHAPRPGWTCYVQDEGALLAFDGSAWQPAIEVLGGASINNLALLGVGTTADETNPFSAKLNNSLWTAKTEAEGGDGNLRYKMSKESAAKTLSVLFQDNFSGRAEIGLTGDDDFHFKVSPDGTTWLEGLIIDKDTGAVSFPNTSGGGATAEIARRDNVLTPHENLVVKYVSATQVDIDADAAVLFDGSGNSKRFASLNETLAITSSGANGLDTGSEGSSRWYHIWAIGKTDGTLDGLLSESAAAPTLPSGYTYKGYLGAVYNDASSNFVDFSQRGRLVGTSRDLTTNQVLSGGTQTSYTAISLAAAIPPTATAVFIEGGISTSTHNGYVSFAADGAGSTAVGAQSIISSTAAVNGTVQLNAGAVVLSTAQQIKYLKGGTNVQAHANVIGWSY